MTTELLQNEVIGIDEFEAMSNEQLEQVAGGNYYETAKDSRFLNSLGGFTNRYSVLRILLEDHDAEIRHGWKRVGVDVEIRGMNAFGSSLNIYKINGKEVDLIDARNHAMKVTGHHMEWEDWNW